MSDKNLIKISKLLPFIICMFIFSAGCSKADSGLYMEVATESTTDTQIPMTTKEQETVFVYVCGAVARPGVYELDCGSRLYEAVEKAGGMNLDADETYLNMARTVSDGEQIVVYTKSEVESLKEEAAVREAAAGLVNINTADINGLMAISGIGESRAKAIIEYREKNGSFNAIEDIMNVDGIKEGLFSKIKDKITI